MKIAPFNEDTMHINQFHKTFFRNNNYQTFDLTSLIQSLTGYLFLNLVENNNTHKKLDKCTIDNTKYYILNGTYIVPYANQLITNPLANGLMLDTTWTILNKYVTSIPTVVIQNVGIPIGMSFALVEDSSIYNEFFFNFANVFGFEIPEFLDIVESDQGKALVKAVKENDMTHLCCLCHLLVSFGRKKYSYQIGNLVTTTTNHEYHKLRTEYEESWSTIDDAKDILKINHLLKKIGHCYENGVIKINNDERWLQVSMQFGPLYAMPSCTNQIESSHGHIN